MKTIGNIFIHVVGNAIAILAAAYFIPDFTWTGNFKALILTSAILTVINFVLRPFLKLLLGPLILLTFGLFIIVINAATLYILDILSEPLIIEGYIPLLLATLLFSVVNSLIGFSAKSRKN